eukprot:SM000133S26821  [mRNA]  locus=s133:209637:212521:- [translate_table: standard]
MEARRRVDSGDGASATSSPPATFLLFSGCPASLSTRQPLQPRQLLLQLPAACKRTATKAAEAAPQRQSKLLPFQRRFAQLQAFLAAADAAAASDELVEELQALSDADRKEHRRNLERRALWLSAIEGMEMELVQRAGVLAQRLPSRRCAGSGCQWWNPYLTSPRREPTGHT